MTSALQIRTVEFQIHEMPVAGLIVVNLGRAAIGVTKFIRPSRFLVYARVRRETGRIPGENGVRLGAHGGFEIVIRDQADHLVALIPPPIGGGDDAGDQRTSHAERRGLTHHSASLKDSNSPVYLSLRTPPLP